ncbi:hypothetical protein N665_0969s0003 [Sinapis alba]|nr:hypothetical protein N665_0969s0003 [Sinapis alba]
MFAVNKALLAKQAWRLISHPSSLLARVYKAKYYRKTTFFEACSYQTSSYAWRRITQTLSLLERGVKWVSLARNWLYGEANSLPPTGPGANIYPYLRVNDLFVSGTTQWDIQKIRSLVTEEDTNNILRIRPSFTGYKDQLCWIFSATGTRSKQGTICKKNMDREQHMIQVPISTRTNTSVNMITRLWKINIPPKIKIFWWKLLHNGLPVAEN